MSSPKLGQSSARRASASARKSRAAVIGAGRFLLGSPTGEPDREEDEGPQINMSVAAFRMDRTPVTVSEFARVSDKLRAIAPNAKWWSDAQTPTEWLGKCNLGSGRDAHPMNCVNWSAARAFCQLVGGDLPTEAEWEFASRAGNSSAYFWGEKFDPAAAISSVSCGTRGCRRGTEAVTLDGPRCNPSGLCDMQGNVWQWTLTEYKEQLSEFANAIPSDAPRDPVHRGGSWLNHMPFLFRSAFRGRNYPGHGLTGVGFRCVYRQ